MTNGEAYALGVKDGEDGIYPYPPAKKGPLHESYFEGYAFGRRTRR